MGRGEILIASPVVNLTLKKNRGVKLHF